MTKERAYFEATTLRKHGGLSPDHVPEVYHFDRTMALIGMRYLEPPHIILRKGLVAGIQYPFLAEHMADYMAKTLFFTSLLYHDTTEHKRAGSKLATINILVLPELKIDSLTTFFFCSNRVLW